MNSESNTYYKNSPYDIIKCKEIIIAKWLSYPNISINTCDKILNNILYGGYKYWLSIRDDYGANIPFSFTDLINDKLEFNIIFYISEYGELLGYTKFVSPQGIDDIRTLNIFIEFNYKSSEVDIIIKNDLSTHILTRFESNLDKNKTEYYNMFTTWNMVNGTIIDSYPKFSSNISLLYSDESISSINSGRLINKNFTSILDLNEIEVLYPYIKVGYFNGDLVLKEWNKFKYRVTSLTSSNILYEGDVLDAIKPVSIKSIENNYLVCKDLYTDDIDLIYDISNGTSTNVKKNMLVFENRYINNSIFIVDTDELDVIESIKTPSLRNYYKSVLNYDSIKGSIVGFEGSFLIFKEAGNNIYTYSNLEGTISIKSSNNVISVVNDTCILEQTPSEFIFYFTDSGITVKSPSIQDIDNEYSHLISRVPKNSKSSQVFDGFRRTTISKRSIPNISDTFGSLIFYIDSDKHLKIL